MEVIEMVIADVVGFASNNQTILCVRLDRLQQSEPGYTTTISPDHQRFRQQRFDTCRRLTGREGGYRSNGGEVEPVDEHTEATQGCLLAVVEQVVAPVDRRLEGPLTLALTPPSTRQQLKTIIEPGEELGRRHHRYPDGGELDRQG